MAAPTTLTLSPERSLSGVSTAVGDVHVTQFRGIQYAEIPERFALSKLVELESLGKEIDCSKYGYGCPIRTW